MFSRAGLTSSVIHLPLSIFCHSEPVLLFELCEVPSVTAWTGLSSTATSRMLSFSRPSKPSSSSLRTTNCLRASDSLTSTRPSTSCPSSFPRSSSNSHFHVSLELSPHLACPLLPDSLHPSRLLGSFPFAFFFFFQFV